MANDRPIAVKDAVHKLQLSLLEGIQDENQLFAAGSLMARGDYEDVVCERSIANLCGYPLCRNPLPSESERPRKGRYRISLKEHKVYDLHETYMYCSSICVVNSRAFASSLQEERCLGLSPAKVDEILRLFGDLSLESKDGLGKNGDLGMSKLKIHENMGTKAGEVSLEEWIGPSNAIEGYVPQIDRSSKPSQSKNQKKGSKTVQTKPKTDNTWVFNEMDFMSAIITEDEYSISKTSSGLVNNDSRSKSEGSRGKVEHQLTISEASSAHTQNSTERKSRASKKDRGKVVAKDELNILQVSSSPSQNGSDVNHTELKEEFFAEKESQFGETMLKSSLKSLGAKKQTLSVTWADEKVDSVDETMLKSSLKSLGAKKQTLSVTWADEKVDSVDNRNLCEIKEVEGRKEDLEKLSSMDMGDGDNMLRFVSAEACASALSQAAEAVASGESDISDAVSEAGIIILPPSHDVEGQSIEDVDMLEVEPAPIKWPTKPGNSRYDIFDPEDSWYDAPPEGFSLTLSPFATMWMSLFAWITSSSLAYIYGRDESFHEDYLSVNGREYSRKIVLAEGRSSEIKQTVAGCLARALPGLVSDLRLPVPISTLEQGMGRLLETMSFVDALPSFRVKQWQVIVVLFLDALSVCRIPALTSHLTSRRMLLHKVLDGAQVGVEEYEVMKDLIIPLGRVPQFSAQSGG